jgi:type VI secretion system protein ImpG
MNKRLLDYYERELRFLRERGREFAADHPAVADRLSLADDEIADPYVRHLTQAFAFLSARVAMRFDDEFPTLSQGLLEVVDPGRIAPLPSTAMLEIVPDYDSVEEPVLVPRGTPFQARVSGESIEVRYTTSRDVTLLPVRVAEARYIGRDLPGAGLPAPEGAKAAISLRLKTHGGRSIASLGFGSIDLLLHGSEDVPGRLFEQVLSDAMALIVRPSQAGAAYETLDASAIEHIGFGLDEAVLPPHPRAFAGSRLLQEYFLLPRRMFQIRLSSLSRVTARCEGDTLEVVLPLSRRVESLERIVGPENFRLHCTPAANLFERICDRVDLDRMTHEHQIIPDRTRPLEMEVHTVLSLRGYARDGSRTEFQPFYSESSEDDAVRGAYYTTRRLLPSLNPSARTGAKAYQPGQVYVSIVDARNAPYDPDLEQLEARALCTNGVAAADFAARQSVRELGLVRESPIETIRIISGPTSPRPSNATGPDAWRLVNRLALNHMQITDGPDGAAALRHTLRLFAEPGRADHERQIEGVVRVEAEPATRPVVEGGRLAWCRGMSIRLTLDEDAFTGIGAFTLGSVLDRYFAEFVSINSFSETTLCTPQRGTIKTWPPRAGRRRTL